MNETGKTLAFVAAALLLGGVAAARLTTKAPTEAIFAEQGGPFFPEFQDPLAVASMRVIDYDPSTAGASAFQVKQDKQGRWTIPSHYNYPADAKERLKNTAVGFIGLSKDAIRSQRREDHKALGVRDPLEGNVASTEGLGKRVTLYDKDEKVLADYIIGKEVPGHPEQRYVRDPTKNVTYAVNFQKEDKVDLSTRFSDWIETNLLKIDPSHIRRIVFDRHKYDPEQNAFEERGEIVTVERKDAAGPWTMTPEPPDGDEVDAEKLSKLTSALADLKIAGVRPKPESLSAELKLKGEIAATQAAAMALGSKGFHMMRNGDLLSNQGDVRVITDQGVVYVLRFGEVTFAKGEDLTAGKAEDASPGKAAEKGKADEKKSGDIESRFLMVTVEFDPSFIPEGPPAPPEPAAKELPKEVFMPEPGTPERAELDKQEQARSEKEKAAREKKVEDGRKLARELSDRFAAWYYVVPGDNFRDIVLDRADLVRKKSDKPTAPPPSFPGFPGAGGPGGPGGGMPFRLPSGHP